MNMNDAFVGSLIFNKNEGGGSAPVITIYNGTRTNVLTDGECSITIVDMGSGKIIQVSGFFKANGKIPTTVEFTDLFIFDAEAITDLSTIPNSTMLCYGQDKGFFFTRVSCHSATNAIASFWGTNEDKWYSFNQTFIVKNSDEEEEQEAMTEGQSDSVPSMQ